MSFWDQFSPDETIYHPVSDERIYWKMHAPSFADERKLAAYIMAERRTAADITAMEIALTFSETTFPHPTTPTRDPDDKGYVCGLEKGADVEAIMRFIDTLPAVVVDEMWDKVKEVAPNWGPTFPRPVRPRGKTDSGTPVGDGERTEGSHPTGE
jgi:hypothetical protein